jgi:penicillin-binding protein 1A
VTLHTALIRSLNLPAIQLVNNLGPARVAKWARRLGFTTPIHADKALALGASCTRTDELTRAFGIFVRGGTRMDPVYLRQIRDRNDRVIEDHTVPEDALLDEADRLDRLWATAGQRAQKVIDPRTAFLMTKLLRDSVLHGIAARCRIVPVPTGGKGGTSSDTMDVWFVGATSRWVTAAWMGDDSYQRPLGAKEASYTTAIPMWANYMRIAVDGRPHRELPLHRPAGLESAEIDFVTGNLPQPGSKTVRIYYRPGSWQPPEATGSR